MKNVINILMWCSFFIASLHAMDNEIEELFKGQDSTITVAASKNFCVKTTVFAKLATKLEFFDMDNQLVGCNTVFSMGKDAYSVLHPDKKICAFFYGRKKDIIAHVMLYDFDLKAVLLSDSYGDASVTGMFTRDGKHFIYARENIVHAYDIENRTLNRIFCKSGVIDISCSSLQQKWHVAALLEGSSRKIGLGNFTGNVPNYIQESQGWVTSGVRFNNDGAQLGILSVNDWPELTQVLLWDVEAHKPKGSCEVLGIVSSGNVPGAEQKIYFNSEDSWCIVNTFLPDTGYLRSYKIDVRSFNVVDTVEHPIKTEAVFSVVNNRCAITQPDKVSVLDWDRGAIIKEFKYDKPHSVAFNSDASKLIVAYDRHRHAIEKDIKGLV